MALTIVAEFDSRRDAEMSVEQLVQVLGIDRTMVFISSAVTDNTAGTLKAGSDIREGEPDPEANLALEGRIEVSVDLNDGQVDAAEAVFRDQNARRLERR